MIALIAAYARNRVIGKDGRIPWKIKGEQLRFRELTMGNAVILGRRSYEEIGKPLQGRYTIIVSTKKELKGENYCTAHSLLEAITIAEEKGMDSFISGGAALYQEAIEIVEKMYLTELDVVIEGDTYFPVFSEKDFIRKVECHISGNGQIPYDYVTYTRIK